MITAQISDKGQITVPAQVRRKLGMKPKSRVEIEVRENEVILRPVKSVAELYGVFHKAAKGKTTDWNEIREKMYEAVAEKHRKKNER